MTVAMSHITFAILMMLKVSMVIVDLPAPERCHFPFRYNNQQYTHCTDKGQDDKRLWCSTTYDYNQDKKWRYCDSVREDSWSVSYTQHSICVLNGSSVNMSCSYTYPSHLTVREVYWINVLSGAAADVSQMAEYKNRVQVNFQMKADQCSLRIQPVNYSDERDYHCRIITNNKWQWIGKQGVKLSVTDLKVVAPHSAKEGDHVTLTCSATCLLSGKNFFIWSKDGRPVEKQHPNNQLPLSPVSYKDGGSYTCAVRGHENLPSLPVWLQVLYPPKNTAVLVSPSAVITKGSSVTLTCSSDANPAVESYTWFKVDQSTPVGSGQQHSISNISSEDGGQYYCEARNGYGAENASAVSITVEGEQGPVTVAVVAVLVCAVVCFLCVVFWLKYQMNRNLTNKEMNRPTSRGRDEQAAHDYENDDIQTNSVHQNLNPNTSQPDADYQNLIPNTSQPDADYQNLNTNTTQPDAVYQSLDPNTTQPDAVYQSLNPNTIQPDAVYQSLNPNTIQPDADYQSLNPNTSQRVVAHRVYNPPGI